MRPLTGLIAVGALVLGLACTGGKDEPVSGDSEASIGGDTGPSGDPDQAPVILEFSANPTSIDEDEDASFYALVTDPQGISDLIGGSLKSSGTTIASFASAADEGSYSADVEWETLVDAHATDNDGSTGTLTLTASFSDQAGNTSTEQLDVELVCPSGDHLCEDGCASVVDDPYNCNGCGNECADEAIAAGILPMEKWSCQDASCLGRIGCYGWRDEEQRDCDAICEDAGLTCGGIIYWWDDECTDWHNWDPADPGTGGCNNKVGDLFEHGGSCVCNL